MVAKIIPDDLINCAHIAVELLDEFWVGAALERSASILLGGELNQQHLGLIDTLLGQKQPGKRH